MEKDEEELQKLRSMIENTKYWISVYASQKGAVSLARYRTARRNLSDLYTAEKALVCQIKINKEIMKSDKHTELRKMDFSKRIESAEARRYAAKEARKDPSKPTEAVFGSGKDSKAQAIIDSAQIQQKLGIRNQQELVEAIEYSERNLVRLKETLARCEDAKNYYTDKKLNCEQTELVKISKQISALEKEQERINEIIGSREKEYIELQRALYGRNIFEGIFRDEYKKEINYNELFERHRMKIDYEHEEIGIEKDR